MIPFDIWISICSIGLCITSLPIALNRKAQNPRHWSIAIGLILTAMMPAFFLQGDYLTTTTLTGQALIWYLIAIFRPIKIPVPNMKSLELTEGVTTKNVQQVAEKAMLQRITEKKDE